MFFVSHRLPNSYQNHVGGPMTHEESSGTSSKDPKTKHWSDMIGLECIRARIARNASI
jgi:hypothetical protein